jgi:hypothetical protein
MSATAKSGTAAPAWTATSWAPAALACMGVVFGDIVFTHSMSLRRPRVRPDKFRQRQCSVSCR